MKRILFTFLAGAAILTSCNKDKVYPDIKQYDSEQIQNYINANGLKNAMQRDTTGGDTSGIYYQIIDQGHGKNIEYSDRLNMVYTIRTFDGKYVATDTILNHYSGYLGQFASLGLPKGLQSAIYNNLKNKGGSMRVLIPSRLAYGVNGTGSGSVENNSRIAGNQCLDYWVRIIDNQRGYDSVAIQNFATRNSINLSEYTRDISGLYYKISGLDTGDVVTKSAYVSLSYSLYNLNNALIQQSSYSDTYDALIKAVQESLLSTRNGQQVSLLIPTHLGYGDPAQLSNTGVVIIPAFSCLKYDYTITAVTNYAQE
ncbi:hypothetical protein EOD41_17660 [Mucilaginibacter limnophilus]|uniref:peptidylprolyl isomerase n=1 Tax=Mucilaginibacter limnophilus TaxID=1932778 RepID=A0A437MKL0_9SPHI|nr:hypothetical protein [Mucilaginibacter limnophilus]RVT98198.1 hypothetical protein EOD41_17660 [Mucilaginibacter limnophilus]